MKRIISLSLTICLICSLFSLFFLTGCGKSAVGTEGAKLLLANERLDESLVGQKIDVGVASASNEQKSTALANTSLLDKVVQLSRPVGASHTWSDFPATSESLREYKAFILNVEEEAERVAADIADMKNNVGVVDKWVKVGYELQMLRVYESSDVLIIKGENEDLHVYYRYTNENAKNVYEMYSLMNYDDGTTGDIRTLLIPGERVEYMYNNSNGFTDYFIAENTRGYWLSTRFNYYYDEATGYKNAAFFPYIVKDGLGYGALLELRTEPIYDKYGEAIDDGSNTLQTTWYTVFSPEENREIFKILDNEGYTDFWLYFSAITDGFVSVSSNNAYEDDGAYTTGELNELKTSKGTYQIGIDSVPFDGFKLSEGSTHYDFAENVYSGMMTFSNFSDTPLVDKASSLLDGLSDMGLTLATDKETLATSIEHSVLLSDDFGESFEWNGYKMNSLSNLESAREVLQGDFDSARSEYEAVKDFEIASSKKTINKNVDFAQIESLTTSNNSYADGIIIIDNISVLVSDKTLLEESKNYTLKVALSLCDKDGNPISVNTIPLTLDGTPSASAFSGDALSATASGKYAVPKNLGEGEYALVVYVATADEGIRVTELKKIGSFNTKDEKLQSTAMDINVSLVDSYLYFEYLIKNSIDIELKSTNGAVTYEDARHAVMHEILMKGSPLRGANLERDDGTAVATGEALGTGKYRMKCYLVTSDGLAESYIYLTIS
ncbi:MAG: hypothetical protein IJ437_06420 [Clostridia bacterium]|nr:hypothetical protein [Clostridia bacterium]